MKSYQSRRINRVDFQVSLLTSLVVIVSCYMIFFINYGLSYKSMIQDLQSRAVDIHKFLEADLDPQMFYELFTPEDEESQTYLTAKNELNHVRSSTGVRYIYTAMVNPQGEFVYVVDGLPADSPDFRHIGDKIEEECIPDMTRALNGELVLPQNITSASWGSIFISYFPLHDGDQVVGVLGIEFDAQNQYQVYHRMMLITPVIILLFCIIASMISVKLFRFISNPSLQEFSSTDFLTGIKSRNAFEIRMSNMEHPANRIGTAIISMDLDHLKQVNDTLGHAVGDEYICFASNVLTSALRKNDIAYRIGGDEFSIILPNADDSDVKQVIQKITKMFDSEKHKRSITFNPEISIGYAIFDSNLDQSLYDTLKRSDAAMYIHKKSKYTS